MSKHPSEQTYPLHLKESYSISTSISDEEIHITAKAPSQHITYTPIYKLQLNLNTLKSQNSALEGITKLSELESLIGELYNQQKITLKKNNEDSTMQLFIQTTNEYGDDDSLSFTLRQENIVEMNSLLHKENQNLKAKVKELEQKLSLGKYIQFEEQSRILTTASQIKQIAKWIEPNGGLVASLLYRASEHGDDAIIFHQKCDNEGPTLTVILTEQGSVIGGYTEASWKREGEWYEEYQEDEKAFLFNVNMRKMFKVKQPKFAIRCNGKSGPIFGNGCDLYVGDDFKRSNKNYVNGGVSYDMESKYELLDGYDKLEIADLEVFKITREEKENNDV